jgi:acetyl-CoA acyltransferase
VRIPFAQTSSIYQDEMAVDLQRLAITGLLTQTALPKEAIDYVICGKFPAKGRHVFDSPRGINR